MPGAQTIEIKADPTLPNDALSDEALEAQEMEFGELDEDEAGDFQIR